MGRLVFISYRRERGYALAHLVNAELRSRGLRTFLDVAESDPGQFWAQAKAAIRSCSAVVLICTNGSFQAKAGDDWVLREISEAMGLGRPIVPVFSQDFELPSALPPPLAQAIEYNGVSMDTQFHVAAFDQLSQLVGGRKRSEQRRRVAIFRGLALLTLLTSLALGAREIIRLKEEASWEREARQAASARSEELAQDIAAIEKKRAEERRGAVLAKFAAHERHSKCISECESYRSRCEGSCAGGKGLSEVGRCQAACQQYETLCKHGCPAEPQDQIDRPSPGRPARDTAP